MSLSYSSASLEDSKDQSALQSLICSSKTAMDRVYPAQKRANLQIRIKTYTTRKPKLSALILTNILLTGPPLLLFTLYTLTVVLFSFSAALITTLVLASLFTASMVGVALLVLVPTVFVTTVTAVILFAWGLLGYWVFELTSKKSSLSLSSITNMTTTERRGGRQVQEPQQVEHGHAEEQRDHHRRTIQPMKQHPRHEYTSSGYDEKGLGQSESERTAKDDHSNHDDHNDHDKQKPSRLKDTETSNSVNTTPPYETKKEAAEKTGDYKPAVAAAAAVTAVPSNHSAIPAKSNDTISEQSAQHAQNPAKQADYKACIAEDGAYIEVAPGLETVHSIAV